ncbi:MAG: PAS domain-containing protein [Gammaproteobacteria bacterium]|nr:PAS domain-containing protein [Gammaproteobacteria bacterium]
MNNKERKTELKKKAEQLVNYQQKDVENINSDEIQRILYDMHVYQIELEMQNDELEKTQRELEISRNRYHHLYHQIPIGNVVIDRHGFIEDSNQFFCQMLQSQRSDLIKLHFSTLIVNDDKNQWINRFDAFFKYPNQKSMVLRIKGNLNTPIHVKLLGSRQRSEDFEVSSGLIDAQKLIISVTDVSDIVSKSQSTH